jgi:sRNA-binding protein
MSANKPNPAHDTIVALAELFPACFAVFQDRRKPLKLGIREDLIAAMTGAITAKEASLALAIYCGNHGYRKACCKAGAPRIDLNGNTVGSVSAEEAANAKQRLAQWRAKQARRQQATNPYAQSRRGKNWEPAPPDPGIIPGGIRDRALKAMQSAAARSLVSGPSTPRRLGLADLRAAAQARRIAAE